jgi:hypothetical protein
MCVRYPALSVCMRMHARNRINDTAYPVDRYMIYDVDYQLSHQITRESNEFPNTLVCPHDYFGFFYDILSVP